MEKSEGHKLHMLNDRNVDKRKYMHFGRTIFENLDVY